MDSGPVRDLPKEESKDVQRLKDDAKSPRDKAPDLTPKEQEAPGGPLGAVVKEEYKVDPLQADEPGKAEPVEPEAKPSKKKSKASPDDLREEIADLQAKVATGQATPKQKCRITEAQAELEEAEKPS